VSAIDLVAVVVAVLGALALAGACVAFFAAAARLRSAAEELEAASEEFRDAAEPLLDLSDGIGQRVQGATGVTYRALTTPVIKGAAVAEGTRRAARRLGGRKR
jgi:hypothetical protein